ncbi:putative inactive receptor kinase [Citrus sinensis]|uniref:Inactive receptor kinase n=1 Tax=Citrus sinensis TaxID=2711 RepID=A0ACB8J3E2_CITSI|nr:putative inactive receptor kinase [Citrus sinensis]
MTTKTAPFFSLLLFSLLHSTATAQYPPITNSLLPSDAVSLLSFKSKADSENKLLYALNERFDYCQWQGVKCAQGRVVRFVLQSFGLRGTFPPNTLTRLDQLRVLSLHNNSLTGPIPDLSSLINLKSLSLSRNFFSGAFPLSILSLHRLTILDLSYNNLTGLIPVNLTALDRLYSLKLEWNRFSGTVPPLNQPFLVVFNVSGNNLTGQVPETPTLLKFDASSFSMNPNLCGKVINKACRPRSPFFESPNATSPPRPLGQSAQSQGILVLSPPSPRNDHKRRGLILGLSIGFAVLVSFLVCIFLLIRRSSEGRNSKEPSTASFNEGTTYPEPESSRTANTTQVGECKIKVETKANKVQVEEMAIGSQTVIKRSGSLVFCAGESEVYSLEQLMRASAELLGRGSIGTTYKAVLDNHLIVTVKRFDANKTADTSAEAFEQHMEAVGGLSHPNLVPIRAYFQAKGERLVIYDYQPNGSLFNLIHAGFSSIPIVDFGTKRFSSSADNHGAVLNKIEVTNIGTRYNECAHLQNTTSRVVAFGETRSGTLVSASPFGSRSIRAKPLHWTSCLKIAEDVAQGLAYIHRASWLIHGNLKSSNVLLGADFEARLTDYCLSVLSDSSSVEDPDTVAYKAPEIRKSSRRATSKSDVYAFGVLLLELLTGKHPSQHPYLAPPDMLEWVRTMRVDDGREENRLGMLTEVASVCSLKSPEQRPAMWQVLKMIQEIKESVMAEDNASFGYS